MLTRKEFITLASKIDLKKEELEKIMEYEDVMRSIQTYKDYAGEGSLELLDSYKKQTEFLKNLQELNTNQNMKRSVIVSDNIKSITPILEFNERKKEIQRQEEYRLTLKKEKRSGYANASILIFVVTNLGLFIAALLLMIR